MNPAPGDPKVFRTALIDGDIIAYTVAASADRYPMDRLDITDRLEAEVQDWMRRAFCSDYYMCLTTSRKKNFRREVYPDYKKTRDDRKAPEELGFCYEFIKEHMTCFSRPIFEADDGMGILATMGTITGPVMVSIDKDLRTVPGWHFNPHKEDFPVYVNPTRADHRFHTQWLTGDAGDNYPGIPGIGPKKAEKILGDFRSGGGWTAAVLQEYWRHDLSYEYALQMARCARILTVDLWDPETKTPVLWAPDAHDLGGLEDWVSEVANA